MATSLLSRQESHYQESVEEQTVRECYSELFHTIRGCPHSLAISLHAANIVSEEILSSINSERNDYTRAGLVMSSVSSALRAATDKKQVYNKLITSLQSCGEYAQPVINKLIEKNFEVASRQDPVRQSSNVARKFDPEARHAKLVELSTLQISFKERLLLGGLLTAVVLVIDRDSLLSNPAALFFALMQGLGYGVIIGLSELLRQLLNQMSSYSITCFVFFTFLENCFFIFSGYFLNRVVLESAESYGPWLGSLAGACAGMFITESILHNITLRSKLAFHAVERNILTSVTMFMVNKHHGTMHRIFFLFLGISSQQFSLFVGILFVIVMYIVLGQVTGRIKSYGFKIGLAQLLEFIRNDFGIMNDQLFYTIVSKDDLTVLDNISSQENDFFRSSMIKIFEPETIMDSDDLLINRSEFSLLIYGWIQYKREVTFLHLLRNALSIKNEEAAQLICRYVAQLQRKQLVTCAD